MFPVHDACMLLAMSGRVDSREAVLRPVCYRVMVAANDQAWQQKTAGCVTRRAHVQVTTTGL